MTSRPDNAHRHPPAFITFEGGEGAGKSTQIRHLAEALRQDGRTVVVTREPGGTPFAEAQRAVLLDAATQPKTPLAEALSFYAARADHLACVIRPALEAGSIVLCDRFSDSTRAYQGAAGGVSAEALKVIDQLAVGTTKPHLTVLLDLPASVGLTRVAQRRAATTHGGSASPFIQVDGFEGRDLAFHERLRQGFLTIAAEEPDRVVVINATGNETLIADQIRSVVKKRCFPERV